MKLRLIFGVLGVCVSGSVAAQCPTGLSYDELLYCIACEGAGATYQSCRNEVEAELMDSAAENQKTAEGLVEKGERTSEAPTRRVPVI